MLNEVINTYNVLKKGGVILYPTDTIWGIGCDATNEASVAKIYAIKKRVESRSMIVLLDVPEKISLYVEKVPDFAYDLIEKYERPLTIIYPKAKNLPRNVVAHDGSIAIRIVRNEFCQKVISMINHPLISTSANISGFGSPLSFASISQEIKNAVDYVVPLYQDTISEMKASTIIRFINDFEYEIVRA